MEANIPEETFIFKFEVPTRSFSADSFFRDIKDKDLGYNVLLPVQGRHSRFPAQTDDSGNTSVERASPDKTTFIRELPASIRCAG
jgi:hypothetical protein